MLPCVAGSAWGQVDEYLSFPADAGVAEQPSPPPLPPPVAPPAAAAPRRPPPVPTWTRAGGSVAVLFSALTFHSLGLEASLLGTLVGRPAPSPEVPGEVEGWLLQGGVEGGYARVGGPPCEGSPLCATRISGGLGAKAGWARGLPQVHDGATRLQTMYFAQLDVLLAHFEIPSAPLSPGVRTWELLTRLRLGLHFTSERSRVTSTGVTFMAAAIVEAVPISSGTQGVSLGFAAGLGI